MHPLLPLTFGFVVGAIGVRMLKSSALRESVNSAAASGARSVRSGMAQAGSSARDAAVSGLSAIEKNSATLRRKLDPGPEDERRADGEVPETPAAGQASEEVPAKPRRRARGSEAGKRGKSSTAKAS